MVMIEQAPKMASCSQRGNEALCTRGSLYGKSIDIEGRKLLRSNSSKALLPSGQPPMTLPARNEMATNTVGYRAYNENEPCFSVISDDPSHTRTLLWAEGDSSMIMPTGHRVTILLNPIFRTQCQKIEFIFRKKTSFVKVQALHKN
jgi:hypothetical protein